MSSKKSPQSKRTESNKKANATISQPWWVSALPAFEPEGFEPGLDYYDLQREVDMVGKCVMENMPADSSIHKLFLLARPITDDKRCLLRRGLEEARAAFDALSREERVRIMNGFGWDPRSNRATRGQVLAWMDGEDVMPSLEITWNSCRGELMAAFGNTMSSLTNEVQISIPIGARKGMVLEQMRLIREALERNWQVIVGQRRFVVASGKLPEKFDPAAPFVGDVVLAGARIMCGHCGAKFVETKPALKHLQIEHNIHPTKEEWGRVFDARCGLE